MLLPGIFGPGTAHQAGHILVDTDRLGQQSLGQKGRQPRGNFLQHVTS
jgi:hypothetical protein